MESNLFVVLVVMLPVGLVLAYNDYKNRLLEANPEVYGVEVSQLHTPKLLAPILPDQKEAIALNAYQEARGEGKAGMIAVTNTVRHRLNDPEFPKTYYEVIYQPKQFSWTTNKDSIEIIEEDKWKEALHIADLELKGKLPDLANGARYYANVPKVDAKKHVWVKQYVPVAKVGNHTFMDKPTYVKAKGIKPISNSKIKPLNKSKKV
jgi:spore germination cell wall hydrolase CwlJ-like protein